MRSTALAAAVCFCWSVGATSANAQGFSVSGPGGAIPAAGDGGGGSWPAVLPGVPFVSVVNVPVAVTSLCKLSIADLNHTWSGDLQFVLIDPTGVGYILISRPGYDSSGPFGNDGGFSGGGPLELARPPSPAIPDGPSVAIPPGTYRQHFGDPNGQPWVNGAHNFFDTTLPNISGPAGAWTLRIYDWEGGDLGSCTGWTLEGNGGCFQPPPPPPPAVYCTAKVNSLGCTPVLSGTGIPSATSGAGFVVQSASNRNHKQGLLLYGVDGRAATVFSGGLLCVHSPVRRSGALSSGGSAAPANDCTGIFQIDMNAFAVQTSPPLPLPQLQIPGTLVDCQFWGRDPGFAYPNDSSLSAGLEYVVGP